MAAAVGAVAVWKVCINSARELPISNRRLMRFGTLLRNWRCVPFGCGLSAAASNVHVLVGSYGGMAQEFFGLAVAFVHVKGVYLGRRSPRFRGARRSRYG